MIGRPVKFRLLEYLHQNGPTWSNKIIPDVMSEYGMTSDLDRDNMNYDLIELAASGFISSSETVIDTEGKFRKDLPMFKYGLTKIGEEQYEWLAKNVKARGGPNE